jgi:hypothetical protein
MHRKLSKSELFSPLFGAGIKGKLLEAMQCETNQVTGIGAESMQYLP